jgi:hypothetical protein
MSTESLSESYTHSKPTLKEINALQHINESSSSYSMISTLALPGTVPKRCPVGRIRLRSAGSYWTLAVIGSLFAGFGSSRRA